MKKFKLVLLIALIFGAGFVAGIVATRVVVRHFVRRAIEHPELVQLQIERELTWKLRLTPDQRREVAEILATTHGQLKQLRSEVQPQFAEIVHTAATNINALLTPEQQERFDKFRAAHRQIFSAQ